MSGTTGWKIATLAFAASSLGLAALLVTRPARIDELEKRPAHERRVREVLGFEAPERTDTE